MLAAAAEAIHANTDRLFIGVPPVDMYALGLRRQMSSLSEFKRLNF
jgi:hypothetical protein